MTTRGGVRHTGAGQAEGFGHQGTVSRRLQVVAAGGMSPEETPALRRSPHESNAELLKAAAKLAAATKRHNQREVTADHAHSLLSHLRCGAISR